MKSAEALFISTGMADKQLASFQLAAAACADVAARTAS
jgi:hypothetical protein